ncbi:MAG: hypothetical protein J5871_01355 [Bacteroidales bacterium]|nr:hypothetical protein [Bacteroidales bacterium]
MANKYIIRLLCKLPPRQKRRFMLLLEGDRVWVHGGGSFGAALKTAVGRFVPADRQQDKAGMRRLVSDIRRCYVRYDLLPAEYFYFGFAGKNWAQRDAYLTDSEEDAVLVSRIGYDKYLQDLSDKYHFYELARPFFHRAIMLFDGHTEKEAFRTFCLQVQHLFVKPLAGSEGDGSFIYEAGDDHAADSLFDRLFVSGKKWMLEERIRQSAEMAVWNASSVNTVRLPTFLTRQGFFVLAPIFRTGRAGRTVDNTSAGGVFALIDARSGRICSEGYDIYSHVYAAHPDSGKTFMGAQIPQWEALLKTAEAAHRSFRGHPYIAWDFALTEQGWELIEGNWGRFRGAQIAGKKGLREQFLQYMDKSSL